MTPPTWLGAHGRSRPTLTESIRGGQIAPIRFRVVSAKTTRGRLILGELAGGVSPRVDALRRELSAAGIDTEATPDVRVMPWEKALTALLRLPVSALFADAEVRILVRGFMQQAEHVARATGIAVPDGTAGQAFEA
jgi:2-dehydropantoate 2-reductase